MLMNSGSIATLRRRVGLLDQGEEDFALPNPMAQGPLAGGNPFNQPFQPAQQGPSSPQATSGGDGLMSRIYNTMRPDLTPAQEYLLSPDEQKRAKGGLLGRVLKQAATLGAYTPSMQAQDRARSMIAEQGMVKERQQAADLESRQGKFRQMAQQILGDPMQLDSETLNMRLRQIDAVGRSLGVNDPAFANVLDNIQPRGGGTQAALQWRDNVMGADGKPYQVQFDPATGKEIQRVRQYVTPQAPRDDNVLTPVIDPSDPDRKRVIYVPRAQAAGMERPDGVGSRAAEAGRIKREDALRTLDNDVASVDEAVAQATANPTAFGIKNVLPNVIRQRLPGRNNDADAATIGALEFMVGRLRHDRFGGALTPLEASKAARIFSEPSSPASIIKEQLGVVRAALDRQRGTLGKALGGGSGGAPAGKTKTITVNGKTFTVPE